MSCTKSGLFVCLSGFFLLLSSIVIGKEPIPVVTGDNYYPFVSGDLPQKGWSVAVVKAVYSQLGKPIKIDTLPWGRGFKWTLEGKYIGTFPYVYSEERNKQFFYSEPINYLAVKIFVSERSSVQNFEQLRGKRLCLPIGYTVSNTIGSLQQSLELIINRAADTKGCFGQVTKGWSDAGLINSHYSPKRIQVMYGIEDKYRILKQDYDLIPLYFIVSRTHPDANKTISDFNAALSEIQKNGQLEKIEAEYLGILSDH